MEHVQPDEADDPFFIKLPMTPELFVFTSSSSVAEFVRSDFLSSKRKGMVYHLQFLPRQDTTSLANMHGHVFKHRSTTASSRSSSEHISGGSSVGATIPEHSTAPLESVRRKSSLMMTLKSMVPRKDSVAGPESSYRVTTPDATSCPFLNSPYEMTHSGYFAHAELGEHGLYLRGRDVVM